jgi:microcystin-dependent protein
MATAAVTYTFANGTNADGTQVNSNFTSVVNFLNTETIQRDASIAFTAIPSLPATDPTTDNQAVRKAYVDNHTPAGVITQYGGTTAPTGWLLCQGQAISRTNPLYTRLWGAISTNYGIGDGSTTFNVPNLQGRIPVGRDSTQSEFDALAETGGSKTSTLTTANLPSHQHGVGTITPNTIANHVHAHSLSVAAHNANHSHTMDHSHTVTSSGSVSSSGPHQHVNAETQFQGHIWNRYVYGYGNDYAIPLKVNAGANPMAVGYGTFSDGGHVHSGTVSVSGTTSGPSNPSVASSTTLTSLAHTFSGSITADGGHTHTMSGSTTFEGSGTAFSNLAPYIVVNYIIKL